jgi:hypothetical protein
MKPNKDLNHTYFSKIDTQEKAYWLGFILGDGWRIRKNGTPGVFKIYKILYKTATIWLDRKFERFKIFYPELI